MTKKYKIASGDESQIHAYVKRAQELWRNATGARYVGTSHDEAVQYFYDLKIPHEGFQKACRRLGQIVSEKTSAEYGGSNLSAKEADSIYKNGERFRDYLFDTLLKEYYAR